MSQARAKSFKTAKSLNYLYYHNKVCIPTNTSRSYSYQYGSLSSVHKFSTLNSAATDHEIFDLQNPNQFPNSYGKYLSFRESNNSEYDQNPNIFYRDTSSGFQRILDHHNSHGLYNASTYNQKSTVPHFQISSRSYSAMVKMPSSSQPNHKSSDEAGGEKRLLEEFDAFCKDQKLMEAVEVLGLLEQHKVSVDIPRYLFFMNECGESQALEEAKHVHHHLTRSLSYLDVYIHNKILEMYLKCGLIEDAYDLFDEMPQRNLTSWDTMITWLAKNGHGEEAIEIFEEFKSVGLKPDNQMFHGVFAACSVVGDMKEGLLHFESMIKVYNLVPSMEDYVTVVDMLGSSGSLNEALEFIEKMPIKPSVEIWEIMMKQSRVHGDLQLGDHCAELVNLLDSSRLDKQSKVGLIPKNPSDIAEEKKNSSRFNPLYDIRTKAHEFREGDTSHPDHEKIYRQLWCLKQTMLEAGYVPQTRGVLHSIDEESKEEALFSHSERLAVSHALLTSPARSTIRVMRNFRLGVDSHNAFKIISMLVGRFIILCAKKRYHHFENGVCSCGDYW